jgi:hypothetical protein
VSISFHIWCLIVVGAADAGAVPVDEMSLLVILLSIAECTFVVLWK